MIVCRLWLQFEFGMWWTSQRNSQSHPHLLCLHEVNQWTWKMKILMMSCSTIRLRVHRLLLTLERTLPLLVPATLIILSIRPSRKSPPSLKESCSCDQWTCWPILLEDVPTPEWTLEDEIGVIASRVMKSRPTPTFSVFEGPLEHALKIIQDVHLPSLNRRQVMQ